MLAWIASQRDQVAPTETSFPKLKRVDQGTREGMSIRCLGRRGISDCWCFCWRRHFCAPLRSRRIPLPAASPTRTGRSTSVAKTVIRAPPGNRSESSRSSIMTGRRVSRYRALHQGVACQSCHANLVFSTAPTRCAECHADRDRVATLAVGSELPPMQVTGSFAVTWFSGTARW